MTDKALNDVHVVEVEDEEVLYAGTPLNPARIDQIVSELRAKRDANLQPGGKSLSGTGEHSPTIQFRVSRETLDAARARAKEEGISVSKFSRRALEDYIAKHNRTVAPSER